MWLHRRAHSKAADPRSSAEALTRDSRLGSPWKGRSLRPAPPPLPSRQAGRPALLRRLSHRRDTGYWARRHERNSGAWAWASPLSATNLQLPKNFPLSPHTPHVLASPPPIRSTVNGKTVAPTPKHVPEAGSTPARTDRRRAWTPEAWAQDVPPPPSLPCPPFQCRDVRFCQVAHTCDVLGLVTTCCLCVIAMQAHRVTPRQEESSLFCPAACIFLAVPVLPSTSELKGRGTDSSIQTLHARCPPRACSWALGCSLTLRMGELEPVGEPAGTGDRPGGRARCRRSSTLHSHTARETRQDPSVFPREPEEPEGQRKAPAG